MKRVSANNCYPEENKMLISIDFYNTNIGLNCESLIRIPYRSMSTTIRDDDNVKHAFVLTKI